MAITIKKAQEIAKLSVANKIVAKTLEYLAGNIHPGLSLKELNAMGESYIHSLGARPDFKGLYGFPEGVCTSVNEVIIHGKLRTVEAEVIVLNSFSAHADKNELFEFATHIEGLQKVFLVHGEEEQSIPFAERLKAEGHIPEVNVPHLGEGFEL